MPSVIGVHVCAVVAGSEDAAVRASDEQMPATSGKAGNAAGNQAGSAARVRRERIAIPCVVGIVGTIRHLRPRTAATGKPLSDANAAL